MMVSAHPNTIDTTRQPPKLGDFFSPYQQQQQPSIISSPFDNNIGYENIHRPQSVTSLPLRQQSQNNILSRQSQNRRSPLMNTTNNPQFVNPLGRPPPLMSSPSGPISQEQLMQNRINSQSQNSMPKNPKLYKTELCRSWMDHGRCNYGERCQYAHGENEKRPIPRHPKYKTEACSSYHKTGYCPYGPRCHFIHNEEPAVLRQLIAQNSAAMHTVGGSEQSSPTLTPTTQRPRNLNLQQTMSAPPSTVATPMQQQHQRQYSNILPIGSRPQPTTPQQYFVQKPLGSDGESPIPSSTDSGSESPLGSFSPGLDLEDSLCRLSPNSFHRSLSQSGVAAAVAAARWSPTSGMPNTYSTSTATSAAVASSNGSSVGMYGTSDPWTPSSSNSIDSPLITSLSSLSFGDSNEQQQQLWEPSKISSPCRLPVFERLSNNL